MPEDLRKQQYGRLFCRYKLAKIVVAVAHSDAYSQDTPLATQNQKKSLLFPPLSLTQWSNLHWQELNSLLLVSRDALLRKDVVSLEEENDKEDEERAESDLYNVKVDRLEQYIKVNKALAGIRASIESQLRENDKSVTIIKVDPSLVAKFR